MHFTKQNQLNLFTLAQQLKEDVVSGGERKNDAMDRYLHELHDVDIGTGMSLAEEIEYQRDVVERFTRCLVEMGETLSRMTGIEYDLYCEIVVNGRGISRSVQYIAEKYNKDTQTIWKYHYAKIRKEVKKVIKYSDSTVKSVV